MSGRIYDTREAWLTTFAAMAAEEFVKADAPLDLDRIRIGVGYPSTGKRSKRIGECWYSTTAADGAHEIFLHPTLQADVARICDVLTHELIHAALPDGEGHGKNFRRVAKALGLEGKMTATVAGDRWREWALPIIEALGEFPGAAFNDGASVGGPKKQTTRYLKTTCTHCDFTARITRKHLNAADILQCPVPTCEGHLEEA